MGDLLEFTTKARLGAVFYKITTGYLKFSIKKLSDGVAAMVFSTSPISSGAYWVVFGYDNKCYIHKNGNLKETFIVPMLTLDEEYKDFWIAWNDGAIRLGLADNSKSLLKKKISEKNLFYVAFTATSLETQLKWKINLPPRIPKPIEFQLFGGEPRWVEPEHHQLPDDAIIGGYENEVLYIIRAKHQSSLTPGKFVPSEGVGYLSWGGGMHEKTDIEVLCGYNYKWVQAEDDNIPFGAVVAGYSEDHRNENLYVGRIKCDGHIIPGKVQCTHRVCYAPYNGREEAKSAFEILVVPCSNAHNEHDYFISNRYYEDEFDNSYNLEDDYNDGVILI